MKEEHDSNYSKFNAEQNKVYEDVINNIIEEKGGLFFVYGSGGCGKTFVWKTICCRLCSERKIVLPVASSGIAVALLPCGRTAHSRFHIPLKLDQYCVAGINHGTYITELIQHTSLIIWDEPLMQHRHGFESVDRCLRDIMGVVDLNKSKNHLMASPLSFDGDFRQILPVIPKASGAAIVGASFNQSKLWDYCTIHLLKQNMCLHSGNSNDRNKVITEFRKWQLEIGDEKLQSNDGADYLGEVRIDIPRQFIVPCSDNPIQTLFDITYPDFEKNMHSHEYLRSRAIHAPTNVVVDDINALILDKIRGETHVYLSQDSIDDIGDEDNNL